MHVLDVVLSYDHCPSGRQPLCFGRSYIRTKHSVSAPLSMSLSVYATEKPPRLEEFPNATLPRGSPGEAVEWLQLAMLSASRSDKDSRFHLSVLRCVCILRALSVAPPC